MALLFGSVRILVVSLIPNLIPLVLTAGLMGFANVPIKPSTILVFGIALGIAVDNAIYLLARYRLELKLTGQDLARCVDRAVREVSVGIIYTSWASSPSPPGSAAYALGTSPPSPRAAMFNLLVLLACLQQAVMTKAFKKEGLLKHRWREGGAERWSPHCPALLLDQIPASTGRCQSPRDPNVQ
jgi:hypothetical protein